MAAWRMIWARVLGMIVAVAVAVAVLPRPVAACDIALVLAMDVSGSVDAHEYQLQTQGIAAALHDPAIIDAMVSNRAQLSVVQWSGAREQAVALPWTAIATPADVRALASRIAAMPRVFAGSNTAVGRAIDLAAAQFGPATACRRWVIDVSGDGDENEGYSVLQARRAAAQRAIMINGLAIESAATGRAITNFYSRWVVTRGGFVITARDFDDFARAMRAKLLRELIPPLALRSTPGPAPFRRASTRGFSASAGPLRGFLRR